MLKFFRFVFFLNKYTYLHVSKRNKNIFEALLSRDAKKIDLYKTLYVFVLLLYLSKSSSTASGAV